MRAIWMLTSVVALTVFAGCSKDETKSEPKPGAQTQAAGESKGEAKPQPQAEVKPEAQPPAGGEAKEEPKAAEAQGDATAEAKKIFGERCATCHGAEGKGDGAASAALEPKPRNYTDQEWQKAVTDQDLRDIIVKGGAGVGKSPLMPPNPDLADKPEVVNGLVALIRSFGKS